MKDQISEELLSAYFDGELSARERARVETWLQSHPEERQKLSDYRRLSRVFEALPRTEVPQEFPTEVLQLAERRMLLPDASVAPRRIPIRVWWLATPAVAAAALLLIFNLSNRQRDPFRGAVADSDHPQTRESVSSTSGARGSRSAIDGAAGLVPAGPPPATPADEGDLEAGAVAASKPPATTITDSDAPPVEFASADSETEQQVAAVVDDALLDAQEADSKHEAMSVVTVYVDGVEGLALIQKFFEDHRIATSLAEKKSENGEEAADSKPGASKGAPSLSSGKQALCVVVTEPEQLVRAFSTLMRERHPAVRIEAQEPIIVAELDRESQLRFAQAEKEVAESVRRIAEQPLKDSGADQPSPAPAARAREEGSKSESVAATRKADAKSASGGPGSRRGSSAGALRAAKILERGDIEKSHSVHPPADKARDAEVASETDADQEQAEVVSRQLVVPVPSGYQLRSRSGAAENRRSGSARRAQRIEQPAADDKAAAPKGEAAEKDAKAAPALVRMLIMVEREIPKAAAPAGNPDGN